MLSAEAAAAVREPPARGTSRFQCGRVACRPVGMLKYELKRRPTTLHTTTTSASAGEKLGGA
jgi:hypothetical protein